METRADGADYAGCGQGDCFFFRDGNGKNYLIDGGSSSVDAAGRYRLEPFLKFRGVKRLDYVWVTHGDVDHLNAVEELLERRKYGVESSIWFFRNRNIGMKGLLNYVIWQKRQERRYG
ncbi:MAG: MBL fold metallo-hydrolase [Coprococcus sp.]